MARRAHPLGRTDTTLYGLAIVLGVGVGLIAQALDSNAEARRRQRAEVGALRDRVDELEAEVAHAAELLSRQPERIFLAPPAPGWKVTPFRLLLDDMAIDFEP